MQFTVQPHTTRQQRIPELVAFFTLEPSASWVTPTRLRALPWGALSLTFSTIIAVWLQPIITSVFGFRCAKTRMQVPQESGNKPHSAGKPPSTSAPPPPAAGFNPQPPHAPATGHSGGASTGCKPQLRQTAADVRSYDVPKILDNKRISSAKP